MIISKIYIDEENTIRYYSNINNTDIAEICDMIYYSLIFGSIHRYTVDIAIFKDEVSNYIGFSAETTPKKSESTLAYKTYKADKNIDLMSEIQSNLEIGIVTTRLKYTKDGSISQEYFTEDTRIIAEKKAYTKKFFKIWRKYE